MQTTIHYAASGKSKTFELNSDFCSPHQPTRQIRADAKGNWRGQHAAYRCDHVWELKWIEHPKNQFPRLSSEEWLDYCRNRHPESIQTISRKYSLKQNAERFRRKLNPAIASGITLIRLDEGLHHIFD